MSSIPEGEVQQSLVAREVFPEATPIVNVSESEAKAAEDIPAASAEENPEPRQEERVATPPVTQEVILEENVPMPDPPATEEEVENIEVATTNTTEANDVVMANNTMVPEANDAPEASVQPEAHVDAEATVPSPRPHTIEHAFDHGQLVTVKWPIMVPPTAPGPQYDYHV